MTTLSEAIRSVAPGEVEHVLLSSVARIVSGGTPKTGEASFWNGDIPWATPKDLSGLASVEIHSTPRLITEAGLRNSSAEILPENSVLFSSRAPIGLLAINTTPMATNQGFKSFVPDPEKLDSRYLYRWLEANRAELQNMGVGATFKEVSKAIVSRLVIPLPPLDEQRRIAAILDKADELRAKRRQALARLDALTQSIFHSIFGDLTDEQHIPLRDAVAPGTIVTYGIVQAGDEYPSGVPYVRTGDIRNGRIDHAGLRRTNPAIAAKFARSRITAGDIVMSIRATVGTVALTPPELDGANLTQGTARIAPGLETEASYLLEYLRTPRIQQWIQKQVKGATFKEITLDRLRQLPVSIPKRADQLSFGYAVSAVEKLKGDHHAQLSDLESLFASLQHRAFKGEL